jgi:hypothetical protein
MFFASTHVILTILNKTRVDFDALIASGERKFLQYAAFLFRQLSNGARVFARVGRGDCVVT